MTANKQFSIIAFTIIILFVSLALSIKFLHYQLSSYVPSNGNQLSFDFNHAKQFIEHGYPEIKTLAIQLLSLLTAILVFSVTFSEKIINFNQANFSIRMILVLGWIFIIAALISDGIGLLYNALSLPFAIADIHYFESKQTNSAEFYEYAFKALFAVILSGFLFIVGLICIVISGIVSVLSSK